MERKARHVAVRPADALPLALPPDLAADGAGGVFDERDAVPPREPEWARTNWQTYAVRLETANQRQVMQRMLDDGVSTRRGVMNAHREGAYPAGTWRAPGPLTRSECAQDTAVALPLFHDMTLEDQDRVIGSLTRAVLGA